MQVARFYRPKGQGKSSLPPLSLRNERGQSDGFPKECCSGNSRLTTDYIPRKDQNFSQGRY